MMPQKRVLVDDDDWSSRTTRRTGKGVSSSSAGRLGVVRYQSWVVVVAGLVFFCTTPRMALGWVVSFAPSLLSTSLLARQQRSFTQRKMEYNKPPWFSATTQCHDTASSPSSLSTALNKPSKTLSVVLEFVAKPNESNDLVTTMMTTRSMQVRKLRASAVLTTDLHNLAPALVQEQRTASGNFPGPAPILWDATTTSTNDDGIISDEDWETAQQVGVMGVIVCTPKQGQIEGWNRMNERTIHPNPTIVYKVESVEQANAVSLMVQSNGNPLFVLIPVHGLDISSKRTEEQDMANVISATMDIARALPREAVIIGSVAAMQVKNREMEIIPTLQLALKQDNRRLRGVCVQQAVVGDGEDLEYAEWIVNRLTQKRSSTFNVSGLTGSTNGHFGGVASTVPKTWLRPQRQHQRQQE